VTDTITLSIAFYFIKHLALFIQKVHSSFLLFIFNFHLVFH